MTTNDLHNLPINQPSMCIPRTNDNIDEYIRNRIEEINRDKIQLKDEFDFKFQLVDYLKLNLESWEVPKQIIVLPEFLYTKSGKIDRPNTLTLYLNNLKI